MDPVFIEQTVMYEAFNWRSYSSFHPFDNGMVSAAESIVKKNVYSRRGGRRALKISIIFSMKKKQETIPGKVIIPSRRYQSAGRRLLQEIAAMNGFVPAGTIRYSFQSRKYADSAIPCPGRTTVLAFYVEKTGVAPQKSARTPCNKDWGYTYHSFPQRSGYLGICFEKPVSRVCWSHASNGRGYGVTTNLFSCLTLGLLPAAGTREQWTMYPHD